MENGEETNQHRNESFPAKERIALSTRKWLRKIGNKTLGECRNNSTDEDTTWLQWAGKNFKAIAGDDNQIGLEQFKEALQVKKSFFAERFFKLFDTDGGGTIDLDEMMNGLDKMTRGTTAEKLKFLFDVYDVDGSGTIDFEELKTVLLSCMEESSIKLSDKDIDDLTTALFEDADTDQNGAISFEELVAELDKHPDVRDNLTMGAAHWFSPPDPAALSSRLTLPRYLTLEYFSNNMRKIIFLLVFFILNSGLFVMAALQNRDRTWAMMIARGCGMDLNFNSMFVLVLMLRYTLTWLRSTWLRHYLPIDQNVLLHEIVGTVIFVQGVAHGLAHFVHIQLIMDHPDPTEISINLTYSQVLFTQHGANGWLIPGSAYISGIILTVILTIMTICSMSCVRRSGFFQVFYWSHTLYVPYWILLFIHGPIFWYFFIVPGAVFVVERCYMSKAFKLAKYGRVFIAEVNLLPSRVTHVVITRPEMFHFRPGDYIYINIPVIAKQEWHPFTISSCPENTRELWLHIRSAGHWTGKLYDFFDHFNPASEQCLIENGEVSQVAQKREHPGSTTEDLQSTGNCKRTSQENSSWRTRALKRMNTHIECFLDGPFGTGSREVFQTEQAVLIANGIGVTPFASILQSISKRNSRLKQRCPNCNHEWVSMPETSMKLRKVDFVWINRDQISFEWFIGLLAHLEMEQASVDNFGNFLEMQMFMTSALSKNNIKAVGLQMALEILYAKENKDLLTGLKTRTQAGRPDWDEFFANIAKNRLGKVKVFFCGSSILSKELKKKCEKFGLQFAKETF